MMNGFAVAFNPDMTQSMSRKDLQTLLKSLPRPAFWMGRMYVIKSKHIGAGIYDVTGDFAVPAVDA